jgi:hypothetical protein
MADRQKYFTNVLKNESVNETANDIVIETVNEPTNEPENEPVNLILYRISSNEHVNIKVFETATGFSCSKIKRDIARLKDV